MAFALIVPPAKVKAGKLTISSSSWANGPFRLMLSIPHAIWTVNLGDAERCDVHFGSVVDEGKMLLAVDAKGGGHFKPTFFKTNILLRLPPLEWMPEFKMPPIDPEHHKTAEGLVIHLPEWAWNKERQRAIISAKSQVARERALESRGGRG